MSLSKGLKKKTTISAALLHEPRVLFMDEPFLDLNPPIQRKLKDWLLEFIRGGGTVFFSTHILELEGKLVAVGSTIPNGAMLCPGNHEDAHFNNRSHLAKYLYIFPGAGLSKEKLVTRLGV
jgi:ABC-2 type transport system ATP-binding protein